ncbi:MAG: hypothetical protein HRU12_10110 [Phaeodactylibacter sp.]|nr:hypothetical protein [Phaeodactylibacter sp.]
MSNRRVTQDGAVVEGTVQLFATDLKLFTHIISIVFYNNAEMLPEHAVDKAAMSGTCTFSASETGVEYTLLTHPTITLGATDYERPIAQGSYEDFSMAMSAVTGATHYKVLIASVGGV